MALIEFPVDLSRTRQALEGIHTQLTVIASALQRLSPTPMQSSSSSPRVAGLSDLRYTTPGLIAEIQGKMDHFAKQNNVVVNSEAFFRSIIEYENQVAEAYGKDAILELPWNKAAGGPLFQSEFGLEAAHKQKAKNTSNDSGGAGSNVRPFSEQSADRKPEADSEPSK